jgi:hypothetical protein
MRPIPARRGPSKWKAAVRFVGIVVLFLSVLGLMTDLLFGLVVRAVGTTPAGEVVTVGVGLQGREVPVKIAAYQLERLR